MDKYKVVIADDHPLMRGGIKSIINEVERFEVVAEASDGEEAIQKIDSQKPDLIILDISMPKKTGLEVLRNYKNKELEYKFIILSNYQEDEYIVEAVRLGAKAYVLKDIEANNIVSVLDTVLSGKTYYSQEIMSVLVNIMSNPNESSSVTTKEKEVLKLISEGMSSKMIADALFVSVRTIETHRYNIMKKLDVNNTAELVKKALKLKII